MGVVCFRLKSNDPAEEEMLSQKLLEAVNNSGKMFMVPARVDGKYIMRVVVHHHSTREDFGMNKDSHCKKVQMIHFPLH